MTDVNGYKGKINGGVKTAIIAALVGLASAIVTYTGVSFEAGSDYGALQERVTALKEKVDNHDKLAEADRAERRQFRETIIRLEANVESLRKDAEIMRSDTALIRQSWETYFSLHGIPVPGQKRQE